MVRDKVGMLACILGTMLLALSPAWGQTTFGTVVGTVSDTSGAVIPAAQVVLTSLATSEKRTATTDDTGGYTFVNVLPGNYRVEVEKEGFKHFTRDPEIGRASCRERVKRSVGAG